ncbi:MAG: HAMP domain-containing histidine kinase [Candidatus Krumholzibacteria bacterium]|nr:HAMP domain-containing histidine kinase [Candidatus Krumholzibacteria bacterium]
MTTILAREIALRPGGTKGSDNRPDRRLLKGYLHKTSNTLCGIKGYASLIADRENDSGEAGQWARKIILEVERMEDIFRSVGDLTRGRGHPDAGVDLSLFVEETASAFATQHDELDLGIEAIPPGELKLPVADLVLILKEILKNCAESVGQSSRNVKVEISGVLLPGGRVFLEIRDNGRGMEPELLGQASSPFITTKEGHHGVGLTRVDTLMDMYGLAWSLESEEEQGTRVLLEVAETV